MLGDDSNYARVRPVTETDRFAATLHAVLIEI
jgi:hypothetical protein